MSPSVLSYPDAHAAGPSLAGGKGWNLARLDRYGFPVPAGGVLSTEVYQEIVARPHLAAMVGALEGVDAEAVTTEPIVQRLAEVRRALEAASLSLPEPAVAELDDFLAREGLQDAPVAVRSSAAAEDGATASFAGIHQSVLGVKGRDAIVAAIGRCYASLWTAQALAYRRRWGIADVACGCAVVICRMVASADGGPPRAAGVAFSCEPRTGRRDRVVLNAAEGLGESLVRGDITPQSFAVRSAGMRWSIEERPDPSTFPRPVLTDDQVQELALLVERVQWALGDGQVPQDVEWAHDGDRFWLVQARPVTQLRRPTFPTVAGQPTYWSNANVKEVVPGVLTTLGWSLVEEIVTRTLFTVPEAAGYDLPPGLESIRRFSGRAYFDLTAMQWVFFDALAILPAAINRDLGGAQPEIEVPAGDPLRGASGRRRIRARLRLLARLRPIDRAIGPEIARILDEVRAARDEDPGRHDLPELCREYLRWNDVVGEFCPRFQLASGYCGVWLTVLRSVAARLLGEGSESLILGLLAGTGQVTSAEHGYRVWDLAQVARRDPMARAWLEATDIEADPHDPSAWRGLPARSPFRRAVEAYLHDFGHRAVVEAEIAQPRWIDDPTFLFAQVRAELDGDEEESSDPRELAVRGRAAAEAHLRRATWLTRPLAFWLVRRARRGMALRESAKSALAATLEPVRRITLELGRRLIAAGHLDEPGDVFHLALRDLEACLLGHWDGRGARFLAADRKAQREAWLGESPPDVITWPAGGTGPMPATGDSRRPESESPTRLAPAPPGPVDRWRGVGASAGRGEGAACVLHSPWEGRRLRKGEVLVAPTTDPGWTPLFLRAAAIVVETGGYLSHGAIVAREYGLPAVVNLPGIFQHIADGDRLVVDGDSGEVIRIERCERISISAHGATAQGDEPEPSAPRLS